MPDTTDIEKKSLEAHVELCAERYRLLENKLESVEEKINTLFNVIAELRGMLQATTTKNNDRLINWGVGIIVALVGALGWMASRLFLQA
jgi:predicted  nucleic acid-binding Zn-ribbon protein